MRWLLLITLIACAAPKPLVPPSCPPPLPARSAQPAAPQTPDEATIKDRSHQLFDAFDRADVMTFSDLTGPTFGLYEDERFKDRALLLEQLKARTERHAPIHSREWSSERVIADPYVAIFIGEATEHVPSDGNAPAISDEGANSLVWVREGERWVATTWTWMPAGVEAERQRWNKWLTEPGFNHKPNQTLVDAVKGRKPGTALDLLMGQGRNALFLAKEGWKVTGVDISDVGLQMARDEAAKLKVKLDTVQSDVDKYDLGKDKWDLVTMIYAGDDMKLVERVKASVKKGGLFVTEYFASDSDLAKAGPGGWNLAALRAAFKDGWKILRADHVEDNADWAGQRKTKLVRFVAQKL